MKKRLYDNLIKIIEKGEFNYYECFDDTYWLNYKCDELHDIEEFREDIIDYADNLQTTIPYDGEEDMGCYLTFSLRDNELTAHYQSCIDWNECGGHCSFEEDFKSKFNKIDFKNLINFSHKNFSPYHFSLNIDFYIKFPFADFSLYSYSLNYKIDDLVIEIESISLKEEIIEIFKETLAVNNYTTLYPVYNSKFEFLIEVLNNDIINCREYYNYHSFKVTPES